MIRVVTDSTCYLPVDTLRKHNISVVPLKVQFGQESFNEVTGISSQDFYRRLSTVQEMPTTSQPSVGEFRVAYQEILADNPAAEIIALTVSSKLSGTYRAATAAAATLPQANIIVFDSHSAALGLGLMTITAAEMASSGQPIADILQRLRQMRHEISVVLMVESLDHLRRGGRVGTATAILGTLLKTKPILTIVEGEIKPLERVRTKKKAMIRLIVELKSKLATPDQPVQAGVMHAAAGADMETLVQMMQAHFNVTHLFAAEFGPVIGVHLGPGALGAGICPEPG